MVRFCWGRLFGLAAGVVGLNLSPAAGATTTSFGMLLHRADDLYALAAQVIAQNPQTQMQAAYLGNGIGGTFKDQEQKFQDDVNALPTTGEMRSTRGQYTVRFAQYYQPLVNAVRDVVIDCNQAKARVELREAHEFLGELHRIAAGHGDPMWMAPSLTQAAEMPDTDYCS